MDAEIVSMEGTMQTRAGAILSSCRQYRYVLWRAWDVAKPWCVVIGLNPSTADERADDPTIRRCLRFARRERCGRLLMLNLFALRSADRRGVRSASDPVGPENDRWLRAAAEEARAGRGDIIVAWGIGGTYLGRERRLAGVLGSPVWCFGTTRTGAPRHPLYVRTDTPLVVWSGTAGVA